MNWIIENWSLLVVLAAVVACGVAWFKKFYNEPTEEQLNKVKEWLVYATAVAEKELGGGTGKLKLRSVYDAFIEKFPTVARKITFEHFSLLVDQSLEQLRKMIETNAAVQEYVK